MKAELEALAVRIVNHHRPPEIIKVNGYELMPVAGAIAAVREALATPPKGTADHD